jgi:enoyl-CoA hydratase/carnithine racemase
MELAVAGQEFETIVLSARTAGTGSVVTITLNRPHRGNSLDATMRAELTGAYSALGENPDLRAVIMTGAGSRHFCTGMDLGSSGPALTLSERIARIRANPHMSKLAALPVPTIAAVNGSAAGGGCEIALACDFRVLADNAQLWLPEVGIGLVPGAGGSQRLPRLIGPSRAAGPLLLGDRLDAASAHASGLAYQCVAAADLMAASGELGDRLAAQDPAAMRAATALLRASQSLTLADGLTLEVNAVAGLLTRRDAGRHAAS